jgi:hypothetical protein
VNAKGQSMERSNIYTSLTCEAILLRHVRFSHVLLEEVLTVGIHLKPEKHCGSSYWFSCRGGLRHERHAKDDLHAMAPALRKHVDLRQRLDQTNLTQ